MKWDINPIQAGGSESMLSLGIGIWFKCMFIAQFVMVSSKKKNWTDNFFSFGAREGRKKYLKRVKK